MAKRRIIPKKDKKDKDNSDNKAGIRGALEGDTADCVEERTSYSNAGDAVLGFLLRCPLITEHRARALVAKNRDSPDRARCAKSTNATLRITYSIRISFPGVDLGFPRILKL